MTYASFGTSGTCRLTPRRASLIVTNSCTNIYCIVVDTAILLLLVYNCHLVGQALIKHLVGLSCIFYGELVRNEHLRV